MGDYAAPTYSGGDQAERTFERIIGDSAALESVLDQVEQVAPTDSTVIIEGETGTGKELIAHAIHNASQRCGRALIKLNCAAIPLDLLESELFGHEKGAFTGGGIGLVRWPTFGVTHLAYEWGDLNVESAAKYGCSVHGTVVGSRAGSNRDRS